MTKINLFDLDFISDDNFDKIINLIEEINLKNELLIVSTPNVDQLVKLEKNINIKNFIKKSSIILPDGQPIIWISKLIGKSLKNRLTGSDLFPIIWNLLKKKQENIFIITPSDEIANKFKHEYKFVETYTPPVIDPNNKKQLILESNLIEQMIKKNGCKYVFLGLGFPKQELITELIIKQSDTNRIYFLLGASFEFYFNIKKRAPLWMRRYGLEWFYRFLSEPKRLFKRYFIDSWYFLNLVVEEMKKNNKKGKND